MKKLALLSLVAVLGAFSKVPNAEQPDGAENYALNCAVCHNPGLGNPGTTLIEQLGQPLPALIGRKDLELDYLRSVVRQGLIEMPNGDQNVRAPKWISSIGRITSQRSNCDQCPERSST